MGLKKRLKYEAVIYSHQIPRQEKRQMEQAHTQLIAQLNERILAADNTPLYIKFAETVKMPCAAGCWSMAIFCPVSVI